MDSCGSHSASVSSSMMPGFSAASLLALFVKIQVWFVSVAASLLALSFVFASDSHTKELDAASLQFEFTLCAMRFEPCWLDALSITGRFDALELGGVEELAAVCETKFSVGFDFAASLSLLFFFLLPFRHRFRAAGRAEIF